MNNHKSEKKIMWYSLAFMAFSTVWGFGNVINGFSEYGGLKAIVSWALIFAIYFVPYALMVGEMGSAFKEAGGGVSSWILETIGPRMAYLAGWTYWIVHMPYISQKPNGAVICNKLGNLQRCTYQSDGCKSNGSYLSCIIPVCCMGCI